jgi:nicotinamide-nucleotide amidase
MFNSKAIQKIKDQLTAKKQKLSVAESVTAGFLQAAFASADQALKYFEGGITTYNINQKVKHLQIDRQKGEECNCVSQQIADEMATGVCKLFGTDYGIAITGYATPVPESDHKLFAFYSIYANNKVVQGAKIELVNGQSAEQAQLHYVDTILANLEKLLSD